VAPVSVILSDLGKVLIDYDHRIASRAIALLAGKTPREIESFFFGSSLVRSFEEGAISGQSFYLAIRRMIDIDIPFEQFALIWNNIFFLTEANKAVHALWTSLRPHYTLAMLSNINELHYAYLKATIPVFDCFHHLFASCEMGVTKPDHAIYRAALTTLGVEPSQVFYIDDRPEMVAAAFDIGINACVYTGIDQLRIDCRRSGIGAPA
jgi:FMN phosphatase YigB (HAD superfamily)